MQQKYPAKNQNNTGMYGNPKAQAKPTPSYPSGQNQYQNVDFDQMIDVEHKVIKIQSTFRKELTLNKLEQDLYQKKAELQNKRSNETPETIALREFVTQLKPRKLTPEAFFRVIDQSYSKFITREQFEDACVAMGLCLTATQLKRLALLLDEDMQGTISLTEYQNALEAYGLSGERHFLTSDPPKQQQQQFAQPKQQPMPRGGAAQGYGRGSAMKQQPMYDDEQDFEQVSIGGRQDPYASRQDPYAREDPYAKRGGSNARGRGGKPAKEDNSFVLPGGDTLVKTDPRYANHRDNQAFPTGGSSGGAKPFEMTTVETIVAACQAQGLTLDDLFNSCDDDGSGQIEVGELDMAILRIKPSIQMKHIQMVHNMLDVDHNKIITRAEFNTVFERIFRASQNRAGATGGGKNDFGNENFANADQGMNDFGEENFQEADEGMFQDGLNTVKGWFGAGPKKDPIIEKIVLQMEQTGLQINTWLESLKPYATANKVSMGHYLMFSRAAYPKVAQNDMTLIAQTAGGDVSMVPMDMLRTVLNTYAKGSTLTVPTLLSYIANVIVQLAATQLPQLNPQIGVETYYKQKHAQLNQNTPTSTQEQFVRVLTPNVLTLTAGNYTTIFKTFVTGNVSNIPITKITESLKAAVTLGNSPASVPIQGPGTSSVANGPSQMKFKPLNEVIPGFAVSTPRTKADKAVTLLIKEMEVNRLQAINVYKLADSKGKGSAPVIDIKAGFKKMAPKIDPVLIDAAMNSFGNDGTMVNQNSFVTTFDKAFNKTASKPNEGIVTKPNPNPKATPPANVPAKKPVGLTVNESHELIRKIDNAFLQLGLPPLKAFQRCDMSGDGFVTMDELRNAFKDLCGYQITPADLKLTMMAFDTNKDGKIDQNEFMALIKGARETGNPQAVLNPEKSLSMVQRLDNAFLDKGISPLDAFKQCDINGNGVITIDELGQCLKQYFGQTIPKAEIFATMKAFDKSRNGQIDQDEFLAIFKMSREGKPASGRPQTAIARPTQPLQNNVSPTKQMMAPSQSLSAQKPSTASAYQAQKPQQAKLAAPLVKSRAPMETEDWNEHFDDATNESAIVPQQPKKSVAPPNVAAPPKSAAPLKQQASVFQSWSADEWQEHLEDATKMTIDQILTPYLNQEYVQPVTFSKALSTQQYPSIMADAVKALGPLVSGGRVDAKGIKVGDLVRFFLNDITQNQFLIDLKPHLKNLNGSAITDVHVFMESIFGPQRNTFTKDDFLVGWERLIQSSPKKIQLQHRFNKWTFACFFYQLDISDNQDEIVQWDTLAKLLASQLKLSPLQAAKPGKSMPAPAAAPQKVMSAQAKNVEPAPSSAIMQGLADVWQKLPTEAEFKQHDVDPVVVSVVIDCSKVWKVFTGFARLQKICTARTYVQKLMDSLVNWFETFKGNEADGVSAFLSDRMGVMKQQFGAKLTEYNTLMLRMALSEAQIAGKPAFDAFQLMIITILFCDREDLNSLNIDRLFFRDTLNLMSEENVDTEFLNQMYTEATTRLLRALELIRIVLDGKQKNGGKEIDITVDKNWNLMRFSGVADQFKLVLKDAAKSRMFVEEFTKDTDGKLSYYEFHQLMVVKLGIKISHDWLLADFEDFLDNYGMAYIQLSMVAEWLVDIGLPEFAKHKGVSDESHLEKKFDISPIGYVLSAKDYFRGCPTILNSEVAALAKANALFMECEKRNIKFFDKDFGRQEGEQPKNPDEEFKDFWLYNDGELRGHPKPNQIAWMRPSEFLVGEQDCEGKFVLGDASSNEVKQGALGDCWFIGALSVLATKDELIRGGGNFKIDANTIVDKDTVNLLSSGVYPPIFHRYRTRKIYVLRFFKEFSWRYVIIDDRIPCNVSNSAPAFGRCTNAGELWVPLIEKAYAKLFGSYQTLISGFIDDGLADMTGYVCEKISTHNQKTGLFERDKEEFWRYLEQRKKDGCLMGCSVSGGGTEHAVRIDGVDSGILSGHAYGLMDVFEINDPKMVNPRKTHRLLRIRNPWGQTEWKGKWSDNSAQIEQHCDALEAYVNDLEEDEQFQLQANDGTFLINYQSWRDIYNKVFAANNFPDQWWAIRFAYEWNAANSGGLPLENTPAAQKRFGKNPQFLLKSTADCEVFVSLQQPDGRIKTEDGTYTAYPFHGRVLSVMLMVFELPENAPEKIDIYSKPLYMVNPCVLHEVSIRFKAKANTRYIIIGTPRNAGQTGPFHLSVYFDTEMHNVDCRNTTDPTNMYAFIEEEYEKSDNKVRAWKEQLVSDLLKDPKNIIGRDDEQGAFTTKPMTNSIKQLSASQKATAAPNQSAVGGKTGQAKAPALSVPSNASAATNQSAVGGKTGQAKGPALSVPSKATAATNQSAVGGKTGQAKTPALSAPSKTSAAPNQSAVGGETEQDHGPAQKKSPFCWA